ncbi:hypothetical protein BCR41DRAFT_373399 [Lobosporangium transversale]|uniref:Uncharacterized protein n=1 Tax=Lobosporangium transversale TaxID=64571 RepID=A0A1Y2GDS5_9FUNG|nr:hypothetical protein BCR41DRAFT_373399 [Lobosporangium transversale]ORZ08013.1 hypothetical protein BCR41DRAFT_373399 [Lobosporangium transversale]|eukprot:XP_021878247.1 hypothetical protein BCR41DRAFT_373399 [Lobosporangium transversale]
MFLSAFPLLNMCLSGKQETLGKMQRDVGTFLEIHAAQCQCCTPRPTELRNVIIHKARRGVQTPEQTGNRSADLLFLGICAVVNNNTLLIDTLEICSNIHGQKNGNTRAYENYDYFTHKFVKAESISQSLLPRALNSANEETSLLSTWT